MFRVQVGPPNHLGALVVCPKANLILVASVIQYAKNMPSTLQKRVGSSSRDELVGAGSTRLIVGVSAKDKVIYTKLGGVDPAGVDMVGAMAREKLAHPERFELPTTWFVARYSIQLSYGRAF